MYVDLLRNNNKIEEISFSKFHKQICLTRREIQLLCVGLSRRCQTSSKQGLLHADGFGSTETRPDGHN